MAHLVIPRPDIETIEVSYEEMRRIAAASDVLERWGLQLVCPKCTMMFGHGRDGVIGDNEQGSPTLTVRCGCTVRRCRVSGRH